MDKNKIRKLKYFEKEINNNYKQDDSSTVKCIVINVSKNYSTANRVQSLNKPIMFMIIIILFQIQYIKCETIDVSENQINIEKQNDQKQLLNNDHQIKTQNEISLESNYVIFEGFNTQQLEIKQESSDSYDKISRQQKFNSQYSSGSSPPINDFGQTQSQQNEGIENDKAKNQDAFRILDSKNENYSNDMLDQLEERCEPMNCSESCCDENDQCPVKQSECKYYKCNNQMCKQKSNGGCCIKGVCRSEDDCNKARISRYISIGIVLLIALIIIPFKDQIQKYFKDNSFYNQDRSTSKNSIQEELSFLIQNQIDEQQGQKLNTKFKIDINHQNQKGPDSNDSCNIIESTPKKTEFFYKNVLQGRENNEGYHMNRDSQITIMPPITNSSSVAHKVPKGVSDLYKSKFI